MTKGEVTAIIPHWGDPATLKRALMSIFRQTHPVVETIVVDDASPEKFHQAISDCVNAMRNKGLAIRLLTMPQNRGPAAARNLGWAAAKTEYIAFLDSDDIWHSEKIFRQTSLMHETGASFSGHLYCPNRKMKFIGRTYRTYGFHQFLIRNRVSTPTVMVKRSLGARFPLMQRCSEDYALWLRLAKEEPIVILDAELARGFKAPWGEAGLSADLAAMTEGQLITYQNLYIDGLIGPILANSLMIWSRIRHLRRRIKLRLASGS